MKTKLIWVFGSNREGRHGKGAAKEALHNWGANYGQPEGLQGESYAIITKELRPSYLPVTLGEVRAGVDRFIEFAQSHPEFQFHVTPIGCDRMPLAPRLAGFSPEEIGPLFIGCPDNVFLPNEFRVFDR